ncbi:N-acetylmuramoyl-L-alanine amidase [Streptomyces sp. P38-E01]|uniref:N-acetylmuramoyl-L-alanine amidase n=1 Tax=Streptomyces tardus TaxID=2780544 RepID=A0A949JHF3_9ACTN|nr:N-acetylmuramoyl-L-alanine amidase [Streptomyces tardus]MBU7598634.1 N-acetylmuramoyl-L-alanine amidase [Streptomyces tardus]
MRALLAATVGSLCTAALIVPLAQPAAAQPAPATELPTRTDTTSAVAAGLAASNTATRARTADTGRAERPARTRTLPLSSLSGKDRAGLTEGGRLGARGVTSFSMLGVVWDDAEQELADHVEVRTRSGATGRWTGWSELSHHATDAPDPTSAEGGGVRGSTAPLWVGESDAVDVRLASGSGSNAELPAGLRLALIDPGTTAEPAAPVSRGDHATDRANAANGSAPSGPGKGSAVPRAAVDGKPGGPASGLGGQAVASSAVNSQLAELGAERIPPEAPRQNLAAPQGGTDANAEPIGPRPGIVTRAGWGANESWREPGFGYTTTVKSAFVHHTAESNNYTCAQAPSVIRSIYQYHVRSLGWRDIGYNFLVDKCGQIYEGRAGGVAKAVLGAHTYGFNSNTTGIAVLGSFGSTEPPKAAVEGVAKLIAWKLGLHGLNPVGSVTLTSGGGKWPAGTKVKMRAVAGHRDGFATECPGAKLYAKLPEIRTLAARLQGR